MLHSKPTIKGHQDNIIPFIPEGEFYFNKGVAAFQKRKFEIAIKWLQKAIEMAPANSLYQCQMSIIYTEIGAYHAANELLTKVLNNEGEVYSDCYYLLANNYAHLGLLNDAKSYAEVYLEREPDGDFHQEAAELLDLIDFGDDTDDEWELDEEDELLMYQETVFHHMEKREWNKALPLLEEMITLFPDHKITKHDYTQALFFSGYENDAIEMEEDVLKQQPDDLYSHINLAVFYYESEKNEAYKTHIQTLLNVYPLSEQQQLRIAITLARTGNSAEAAYERFRKLRQDTVKHHLSYYKWYSIAAYKLGEPSKALSLWEEGCRRHPALALEEGPWAESDR